MIVALWLAGYLSIGVIVALLLLRYLVPRHDAHFAWLIVPLWPVFAVLLVAVGLAELWEHIAVGRTMRRIRRHCQYLSVQVWDILHNTKHVPRGL